jgi:HEAT repeat protein
MSGGNVLLGTALHVIEAMLSLCLAILFGNGLRVALRAKLRRPRLERGYRLLYELLHPAGERTTADDAELHACLHSMSRSMQEDLILPLGLNLERTACAPLRRVADRIGLLAWAEGLCGSRSWGRRLRGARILCALHTGETVMPRLFGDEHPAVRAKAAEWAAANPFDGAVAGLLEMVHDRTLLSRYTAQDALLRLGWIATDPLARYLEQHKDDDVEAVLGVATAMPHPAFSAAAILHCDSVNPGVRARAIELVGAVGGAEGATHVARHLGDSDAGVRAAAAIALGRMGHWPRAHAIAERMRDPSWNVRRAAGLSLRALGSPGVLVLRRMTADRNAFAADMARQVLDLPSGVDEVVA